MDKTNDKALRACSHKPFSRFRHQLVRIYEQAYIRRIAKQFDEWALQIIHISIYTIAGTGFEPVTFGL